MPKKRREPSDRKDARLLRQSRGFGKHLIERVLPSLFGDADHLIIDRACILKNGKLTERFSYLKQYASGNEVK